ncbi:MULTISPECIES: TauD/TfdA family dioxygenase [unclassified Nostoc]|uniref:TauD/TfdA family dioxygenase n=1 Tax=unclassified Nostoc TaxID=2593658 RepID=UPI002AD3B065|nr:TauD/TfdA family dioxygenase [Nostoc sp. DedQUE03]MDZ7975466.1 TauD/TfdA family dioxygenase [Nostoc sp. DedQUE03]MDZ8045514.1 TauD/TfdA family dioxygenase [Nostoc sp. DedQUE02]
MTKIKSLGSVRRKAVNISTKELITTEFLNSDTNFPLVMKPSVKGVNLQNWAKNNREYLKTELLKYGALLFRDFKVNSIEEFEQIIAAICKEAMEYRYRASPRTQVSGRIYTSTDYPADQSIFPHNEHAYSPTFPLKIFFFCMSPAKEGGETPIGNCRKVFERIDPTIRDRFIEKQVMYMRNFGDGFGLPWQTVFQTTDKTKVEEYCQSNGIQVEWKAGDRLRTRQVGPAIIKHPQTGEMVWFNHATFFHVSTLEPTVRESLLKSLPEEDLPTNTYYGDGSAIEPSVLAELRAAYQEEMVTFSWQKGDVLMLDNMLSIHARQPFVPPRRILVGMAEPYTPQSI